MQANVDLWPELWPLEEMPADEPQTNPILRGTRGWQNLRRSVLGILARCINGSCGPRHPPTLTLALKKGLVAPEEGEGSHQGEPHHHPRREGEHREDEPGGACDATECHRRKIAQTLLDALFIHQIFPGFLYSPPLEPVNTPLPCAKLPCQISPTSKFERKFVQLYLPFA